MNHMRTLRTVVRQAHKHPYTVSSDFARRHAEYVAMAASKGLISTRVKAEHFARTWFITVLGLQWLNSTELEND